MRTEQSPRHRRAVQITTSEGNLEGCQNHPCFNHASSGRAYWREDTLSLTLEGLSSYNERAVDTVILA